MEITKELLLNDGFEERLIDDHKVYVKGHIALIHIFNMWIPCYYSYGNVLSDRLYVNTMEELAALT